AINSNPRKSTSAPYYPATSPYVTAVGGTSLVPWLSGFFQVYWPNSGSGCSRYEPLPGFQPDLCGGRRSAVDIAALADPYAGVSIYTSSDKIGWVKAGGTSVGAPIVAAAYALSGNPEAASFAYHHRSGFNDIGSPMFDLKTGLGTPQGLAGF